jgi:two-component system cell cycle sensor histidine kinase/response regulator CckA
MSSSDGKKGQGSGSERTPPAVDSPSDAVFRLLIERLVEYAVMLLDTNGVVLSWNAGAERINGYSRNEIIGQRSAIFFPPEDRAAGVPEKLFQDALVHGYVTTEGWRVRKNGERFWADSVITAIKDDNQHLIGFAKVVRDASDRRRAADELAQRAQELSRQADLLDLARDAIIVRDLGDNVSYWNRGAERMYGYSRAEALGRESHELLQTVLPESLDAIMRQLHAKGYWNGELKHRTRAGEELTVESRWALQTEAGGRPIAILELNSDITSRKRLEADLLQSQKMQAIGSLAGGVAHDFNNLLTIISGHCELLLERRDLPPDIRPGIVEIARAGDRAGAFTRQLLTFSRHQPNAVQTFDLAKTVSTIEPMLRRLIAEDVELVTHLAAPAHIRADPSQIEQVLLNLVINARDAMPVGGRIGISVEKAPAMGHGPLAGLKRVLLKVEDTGSGIAPEIRERIFEPFFTTKPLGQGTGLGLATSYGIVRQSGGEIEVDSKLGAGTTFTIVFPEAAYESAADVRIPARASRGRGGTVLVVEDEESLRRLIIRVLKREGYSVIEAANGMEAMDVSARLSEPINLLLTDVVMPRMSGPVLARTLRESRPEIKVLYISGYTENLALGSEPNTEFLQKPFPPQVLSERVGALLSGV